MPIWAYIGGGALLAGLLGGWTVRDWKADSDERAAIEKAIQKQDEARKQGLDAASQYAQFSASNGQAAVSERNTIREIYRNVEVPSNCAAPADAVGLLSGARDRANAAAAGEPRPAVSPTSGGTHAPDRP